MKNIRKFISIIGILILIISCCSLFGCDDVENVEVPDCPYEYTLSIDASEQKKLVINQRIEYYSEITADNIVMQCYSLAYAEQVVEDDMLDKTYPNGFSKGETKINIIKVNGEEKKFNIDNSNQSISIEHKTKAAEKVILEVDYELTLANVKHRLGYCNKFYSLTGFYPYVAPVIEGKYSVRPYSKIGEAEFLNIANFSVDIVLPKGNVVVHTGVMDECVQGEKNNTYKIKATNVRDFSVFWSTSLSMKSRKVGDTTIKYYYNNDTTPIEELNIIENTLKTFGELFGDYGHENLSVVLAPFAFAGMEYSEIAVVSNELSEKSRQEVIIHEIAHQWWYMKVATDQAFSPWLDESLAEFSTALYYLRNNDGKTFEKFRQYGLAVLENRIISNSPYAVKGAIYDFDSTSYSECVYTIGSLMWINYYSIKGPSMIEDLKSYATAFTNKKASEKDISEFVFKGYDAMLNGWLNGSVVI